VTTPRYLPVEVLKDYVRTELVLGDALYEDAINAAETIIDNACRRRFELVADAAVAEERLFRPTGSATLYINDCTEITSVVSGGATLTLDTEYSVEPLNGLSEIGEPWPYYALVRYGGWWPYYTYGPTAFVAVTAKWGWPAIPPQIREACKIIAKDVFNQRDIRFGLVTVSDVGGVGTRENRIVRDAVRDYGLRTGLVSV
jgi:hypothetical protein